MIYGATSVVGKDYDMPLAVLSSLTLGLSVDFAIHLLQRVRDTHAKTGSWEATREALFEEPARAIARNAVVIAIGFLPLLTAPLVPYNTVGVLMAAIMIVSGAVTLGLLPSILGLATQLFPGANRRAPMAFARTEDACRRMTLTLQVSDEGHHLDLVLAALSPCPRRPPRRPSPTPTRSPSVRSN